MNQALHLERLFALAPIRNALSDPHYRLIERPVDGRWADMRVTGRVTGFNPQQHEFYYASRSELADWLAGRDRPFDLPLLTKEALSLAHDYLHSWAYRRLHQLSPSLTDPSLESDEDFERHSFLLTLTECVAVTGLDYWYLCVSPASERLGDDPGYGGPLTVNYEECLLPLYRESFPSLNVQEPEFFLRLLKLYAEGCIDGVDEDDLVSNGPLADWLIRELLIAPRQRTMARFWHAHRAGRGDMVFEDEGGAFRGWPQRFQGTMERLAHDLWDLMTDRAPGPPSPPEPWIGASPGGRRANAGVPDYRFRHWRFAPQTLSSSDMLPESWIAYVDQVVGQHVCPEREEDVDAIAAKLQALRSSGDSTALRQLLRGLERVPGQDTAPEQLIIVN